VGTEHIGPRLKDLRNRRGLTGEQFADLVGFNQSYISEVETGKKIPPLKTLEKFAKALGVSLSFFTDEEYKYPIDVLLPPEYKKYLLKNKGFVELIGDMISADLTPEDMSVIIKTIKKANDK
jgi:transcriptional regulator with XRE-family HTH domain